MIPQTAAALLIFVLLLAPGMTFELLRQARRPALRQTILEELYRILLASLLLTGIASVLLFVASALIGEILLDFRLFAREGLSWYWENRPYELILSVSLEVLVATILGALVHRSLNKPDDTGWASRFRRKLAQFLGHRPGERIERFPLRRVLFRDWQRPGTRTVVTIIKKDGCLLTGALGGYDTTSLGGERDIAIEQPISVLRPGWPKPGVLSEPWHFLLVPADEISEILVTWQRNLKV